MRGNSTPLTLFFLQRTQSYRKDPNLFVSYVTHRKGYKISSQRLSKWIAETIKMCYLLAKHPLPGPVHAHSTRALATSAAFLKVTLLQMGKAATWATPHTFETLCLGCPSASMDNSGTICLAVCLCLSTCQHPPPGRPELATLPWV